MNGGNGFMATLPNCPKCNSEYTYEDGVLFVCPECAHEWGQEAEAENNDGAKVVKMRTETFFKMAMLLLLLKI